MFTVHLISFGLLQYALGAWLRNVWLLPWLSYAPFAALFPEQ